MRAGLPVDAGTTPPTSTAAVGQAADDEQPTGEFPAVTATDTPDDDRPTGEFPAVEPAAEDPASVTDASESGDAASHGDHVDAAQAVSVDASDEPGATATADAAEGGSSSEPLPHVPDPIWETPQVAVPPVRDESPVPPPIWTDSPPETQSPLTASVPGTPAVADSADAAADATPDGPTLAPPTLSKPAQLDEALALPDDPAPTDEQPVGAAAAPAPEADEQPTIVQGPVSDPTSATSVLNAVDPPSGSVGAPEPETADSAETPSSDAAHRETATAEAAAPDADATAPADDADAPDPADGATAPADDADAPADKADNAKTAKERLSLTGRFTALKRRVAPRDDQATVASDALPASSATPEPEAAASAPAEPAGAPAEPTSTTTAATPVDAPAAHDDAQHKPSFSERAALRRRVKTLRARRDTGLLELGAIVLDQRRFGDPTGGALLRRRTDELGDLDNEIAAIERALDDHASAAAVAALGAARCVGCNSLVGPTDRYCAHCGTPRPVGPSAADHTP